jgi:hypothetical protein
MSGGSSARVWRRTAPLQGAAFQPLSILLNPLPEVGAAQYVHRRLGNIECGGVPLEEAEESCLLPCKCGRLHCRRDPQPVQLRGPERLQVDQLLLQRASDSLELTNRGVVSFICLVLDVLEDELAVALAQTW